MKIERLQYEDGRTPGEPAAAYVVSDDNGARLFTLTARQLDEIVTEHYARKASEAPRPAQVKR